VDLRFVGGELAEVDGAENPEIESVVVNVGGNLNEGGD